MPSRTHAERPGAHDHEPLQLLGWFALMVVGSFLFGVVVPGLTALHAGVFFAPSTKIVVLQKHPEIRKRLDDYQDDQNRFKKAIDAVDERIATEPGAAAQLAALRQKYEAELKKPAPVSIQPFYLHLIMYFWPIMYFGLGSAAFIMRPSLRHSLRFFQRPWLTTAMTASIFAFSNSPLLFRTLYANGMDDAKRTVFAYPNPDIDLASFLVQQFNFEIFSFLLAVIWFEWANAGSERRADLKHRHPTTDAVDFQLMEQLSTTLLHWQVIFLAVSVGFVVYTAIFWDQIIIHADYRFGYEAIDIHVVWLVTIIITATPFALTSRAWRGHKMQLIAALVNSGSDSQTITAKLEAIRELRPIGFWNMTASGLTVLASFAAPLIQAYIKKGV